MGGSGESNETSVMQLGNIGQICKKLILEGNNIPGREADVNTLPVQWGLNKTDNWRQTNDSLKHKSNLNGTRDLFIFALKSKDV